MKLSLMTVLLAACALNAAAKLPADNPFAAPSALPYQFPPFDKIKPEHFRPAFEEGMKEQRAEVDAIISSKEEPTFENTIVAMERSGRLLARTASAFYNLNSSDTNDELQKIDTEMAPKLTAHQDSISMDPGLFARIRKLYDRRSELKLGAVDAQLLDRYYKQFSRAGALLGDKDKEELKAVNKELSELTTKFDQNLRKGAKAGAVHVTDEARLDGFSEEQKSAAAEAAKARDLKGWLITLQNTTIQPALESLKDRALREQIFRASVGRNQGGEFDNLGLAARIVALRARQARLLGYPNYAAYSLADQGAATAEAVNAMLAQLAPAALKKAGEEAADIQARIDEQEKAAGREPFKMEPWDWAFYAGQARKERYSYDDAEVKPYFELERVTRDGIFYAATKLYGITFKRRNDLPVYNPDVQVYEVFDADGSAIGLLALDNYKRDSKKGGAWMNNFVDQDGLFGLKPVITINLNVPKPGPGGAALLTFDEVETFYHEMGHVLHGLFSTVKYPTLAGTNVPRDFVEFPSQINEMFLRDPETLSHFARHYQTGEPMPTALRDRVLASLRYGQGFATAEYVAASVVDQAWHQLEEGKTPPAGEVLAFEAGALKKAGLDYAPIPPRYRSPYFAHSFSGGYQASYYAYVWSEVLARDGGEWFKKRGGYNAENGAVFREKILSRGRTSEPAEMFEEFYGGKPEIGPLLEWRGLTLADAGK